jgi:hypothetical protein
MVTAKAEGYSAGSLVRQNGGAAACIALKRLSG